MWYNMNFVGRQYKNEQKMYAADTNSFKCGEIKN